jgi:dTDP-4-dehydrorhamnose reductase
MTGRIGERRTSRSFGSQMTRVLVLGATGMLGRTLFLSLSKDPRLTVYGTVRDSGTLRYFPAELRGQLVCDVGVEDESDLLTAFASARPDVVVNCIGIIKQLPGANNHLKSLAINSALPHRLAKYGAAIGARLIHFSTDCVFSGNRGGYMESDSADAYDLYGRTKLLGEVEYPHCLTLRTSIIGHEINRAKSLVDWFLAQSSDVKGFRRAVFSGLPTAEVARVLSEFVLPNENLSGLYHLSVEPINKFDLLNLVAQVYGKQVSIEADDQLVIDRSLNSDRFRQATGFAPRSWPALIAQMHDDYQLTHAPYRAR